MKLIIAHIITLVAATKIILQENVVIKKQFNNIGCKLEKIAGRLGL